MARGGRRTPRAPEGSAFEVILPGPVSIARRMIEGWVASG